MLPIITASCRERNKSLKQRSLSQLRVHLLSLEEELSINFRHMTSNALLWSNLPSRFTFLTHRNLRTRNLTRQTTETSNRSFLFLKLYLKSEGSWIIQHLSTLFWNIWSFRTTDRRELGFQGSLFQTKTEKTDRGLSVADHLRRALTSPTQGQESGSSRTNIPARRGVTGQISMLYAVAPQITNTKNAQACTIYGQTPLCLWVCKYVRFSL
jgi:hypothetical protein